MDRKQHSGAFAPRPTPPPAPQQFEPRLQKAGCWSDFSAEGAVPHRPVTRRLIDLERRARFTRYEM
jgi:hypothetical protein